MVSRLSEAVGRWGGRPGSARPAVDSKPACSFGLVVDQRLCDLERAYTRIETRINGLILAVLTAIVLELWRTLTRV